MAQVVVTVNGVDYALRSDLDQYTVMMGNGYFELKVMPSQRRPERKCEHCGRADWVEARASSWEEAVEWGWFIPVEAQ